MEVRVRDKGGRDGRAGRAGEGGRRETKCDDVLPKGLWCQILSTHCSTQLNSSETHQKHYVAKYSRPSSHTSNHLVGRFLPALMPKSYVSQSLHQYDRRFAACVTPPLGRGVPGRH